MREARGLPMKADDVRQMFADIEVQGFGSVPRRVLAINRSVLAVKLNRSWLEIAISDVQVKSKSAEIERNTQ